MTSSAHLASSEREDDQGPSQTKHEDRKSFSCERKRSVLLLTRCKTPVTPRRPSKKLVKGSDREDIASFGHRRGESEHAVALESELFPGFFPEDPATPFDLDVPHLTSQGQDSEPSPGLSLTPLISNGFTRGSHESGNPDDLFLSPTDTPHHRHGWISASGEPSDLDIGPYISPFSTQHPGSISMPASPGARTGTCHLPNLEAFMGHAATAPPSPTAMGKWLDLDPEAEF